METAGGFWTVFRREIRVIAHSPFYLLFMFILPVISFGIMAGIFYREIPRDMRVVVCDRDDSKLSRQLTRMVEASPALAVIASVRDTEQGAGYIRRGEAYAEVYIPEGLERGVKRGDAPAVTVYYNNQSLLVSGLISRAAREIVGGLSAGLDVRTRMAQGEAPQQALERYDPIRLDQHLLFNPNLNYRYYLLPAVFPSLLQAFIVVVLVRAVGSELRHGTAGQWLAAAGGRTWVAVAAKTLPYTVCFLVVTNFMVALLVGFTGMPVRGSIWVLVLGSVLFVLAYQSTALLIVALAANLREANSIAGFYTGPAFAFAGITFPAIGMPLAARIWNASLPLSHYIRLLLQQALRGAPPQASASTLLILAMFAVIPLFIALPRMGRLMRDPSYWGRL